MKHRHVSTARSLLDRWRTGNQAGVTPASKAQGPDVACVKSRVVVLVVFWTPCIELRIGMAAGQLSCFSLSIEGYLYVPTVKHLVLPLMH